MNSKRFAFSPNWTIIEATKKKIARGTLEDFDNFLSKIPIIESTPAKIIAI